MLIFQTLKTILKNKYLWFWGIGFVAFWIAMGAFVFSTGYNGGRSYLRDYVSVWFTLDSIFSVSSIAITFAYTIFYASSSLSYLFKNSKLKPSIYYLNNALTSGIVFLIMGTILLILAAVFFYIKFGVFILPRSIPYILVLFFISGLIFYNLALILVTLSNNWLGLKNVNYISFIPMFIGMGFGYSILYAKLPSWILYGNFISPLMYLYQFAYNNAIPSTVMTNPLSGSVELNFVILSVCIWTVFLSATSVLLIKYLKGAYIEEARNI